jgi:hypothetical protein
MPSYEPLVLDRGKGLVGRSLTLRHNRLCWKRLDRRRCARLPRMAR